MQRDDDKQDVMDLIEGAMNDVEIVGCPRCGASGKIGLPSMQTVCHECQGSKLTTRVKAA